MTELQKLTPDIYRLKVPFLDIYTTVFIITTDSGAILFDTATYPDDIDKYLLPALMELGITADMLRYAVISHDHRDHAGGLERFCELFPATVIAAGSDSCKKRIMGRDVLILSDGDMLLDTVRIFSMPGHTSDCIGVFDTRTKTLLSGDALQLYGIYGSGSWGANITKIQAHLNLINRLCGCDIATVAASHDYHPCGWRADGKEQISRYLDECKNALYAIRDTVLPYIQLSDEAITELYNSASGMPTVGAHVIKAIRKAIGDDTI